jgi:hypothetical protein
VPSHGVSGVSYPLTTLDIDLFNPQNTVITAGISFRTMTDVNAKNHSSSVERIEIAEKDIAKNRTETSAVQNQVVTQYTQLLNDAKGITASALEEFVETGEFHELREYTESELKLVPDKISASFNQSKELIDDVNGDLQKVIENLEKHFGFTIDGLVIKAGEGDMELLLDNDVIRFRKNGVEFGWWDGTNFHTGNIFVDVEEQAQFGNYAFVPYADEETDGLDFVRVGG